MKRDAYIIIDIGTGNVRVAVVTPGGEVLGVGRGDIIYKRDDLYPESIYFDPGQLWKQIIGLGTTALRQAGEVSIKALTTTSQREGIVLMTSAGGSLIGLPNIDHRGREWEDTVVDKSRMYQLSGRFPTSLFSAYKLEGIRQRRTEIWQQCAYFLSISDWAAFQLCGVAAYEHSQASETLLYDVAGGNWSNELAAMFDLEASYCPALTASAEKIGTVLPGIAHEWRLHTGAIVVTGGGDTQLAIKSTQPQVDDIVIVSGTTTPIVKITDRYITDKQERTWTSRDIEPGRFVFEANAGVTGLNYQRLKEVFYPNEGYDVIERELALNPHRHCVASLGSLIAAENKPVLTGGFVFPVPVSHELSRSSFVWATLMDIAFSIAGNYEVLKEVSGHDKDYMWACGGGLQSPALRQLIATILGKKVQVRKGFEQASAIGGALICNRVLEVDSEGMNMKIESVLPQDHLRESFIQQLDQWKQTRNYFKTLTAARQ
jgi:autoinducer 2 (AI-2) kinase